MTLEKPASPLPAHRASETPGALRISVGTASAAGDEARRFAAAGVRCAAPYIVTGDLGGARQA